MAGITRSNLLLLCDYSNLYKFGFSHSMRRRQPCQLLHRIIVGVFFSKKVKLVAMVHRFLKSFFFSFSTILLIQILLHKNLSLILSINYYCYVVLVLSLVTILYSTKIISLEPRVLSLFSWGDS